MSTPLTVIDAFGAERDIKYSLSPEGELVAHRNIDTLPGQHVDSFSRIRTSDPAYRFDSQFTYDIDADLWDKKVTGDGAITHDGTNRMARLVSGATAGSNTATIQAHYHSPYTAGRGMFPIGTFIIPNAIPANGEVGVGYFDGYNGVYLKKTDVGVYLGLMTTTDAPDALIPQDEWNIDTLGAGVLNPSRLTLDTTKSNILGMPMQALYAGRVVMAFDIGGQIIPVHEFNHANITAFPYIAQASLPIRYWANTNSSASAATIYAICCTVMSEGGQHLMDIPGREFVASNGITSIAVTTRRAILTIRCLPTLNSINQNAITIPLAVELVAKANDARVEIVRNGALGGTPAWTPVKLGESVMERDVAGTTVTGGTVIDEFYAVAGSASGRQNTERGIGGKAILAYSHLLAAGDTLSIVVTSFASTTTVNGILKWKEIR